MNISAKELRTHTKLLLDAVERGEEVTITYHGQPKARVVGIDESNTTSSLPGSDEGSELFGLWRDRDDMQDPSGYVRELRKGRFQ